MQLFIGLILFSGVFGSESDAEAVVETVADEAPPPTQASTSEQAPGGVQAPVSEKAGQGKKVMRERIYTEEEKKQMRQLMREREEYNRQVKIFA